MTATNIDQGTSAQTNIKTQHSSISVSAKVASFKTINSLLVDVGNQLLRFDPKLPSIGRLYEVLRSVTAGYTPAADATQFFDHVRDEMDQRMKISRQTKDAKFNRIDNAFHGTSWETCELSARDGGRLIASISGNDWSIELAVPDKSQTSYLSRLVIGGTSYNLFSIEFHGSADVVNSLTDSATEFLKGSEGALGVRQALVQPVRKIQLD